MSEDIVHAIYDPMRTGTGPFYKFCTSEYPTDKEGMSGDDTLVTCKECRRYIEEPPNWPKGSK